MSTFINNSEFFYRWINYDSRTYTHRALFYNDLYECALKYTHIYKVPRTKNIQRFKTVINSWCLITL